MDPMTQSAQISSSQGFADGQNSAAKESKMSDKRVIRGSDKPCEGVATSLRFPSQPGSFSSGNYGSDAGPPDEQPDSPIKTSPVSERIKALEALAAKKKEPDFRSDGGFSHFRDRHHEKTSPEIPKYIGETPISPTESQKSPTETQTQKSPTESQKSPTETQKSPTETQKSPTESQTQKSPTETQKSPTETQKSPTETQKSPTETQTQKSPTESQKSPTETQKSPTETQKSPTESQTQKSPTETQKSPNEKIAPTVQKKGGSADQSPESPFEVLEDLRHVNEFEETEEWMKAHLPPVLEFDALIKGAGNVASKGKETDTVIPDAPAAFAGVPDAFMDSPVEPPKQKDEFSDAQKQPSVEEEFDLSFLPTAYMWDQQEKSGVQASSNIDSVLPSSPAPPAGFDSPSPPFSPPAGTNAKPNVSGEKDAAWTGDLEPREASEADSSGESDDTVIEDGVCAPSSVFDLPVLSDPAAAPSSAAPDPDEKVTPPPKSERKLMQVPTINVIETDEPNYSEEEMEMEMEMEPDEDEDYEVVKDPAREVPKTSEPEDVKTEPPKTRPIETEFMEGYSPPSSPVDSDGEYSPKHKTFKSGPEACHQESTSKSVSNDSAQSDKSQAASNTVHEKPSTFVVTSEDVDFPDNNDEWSDEALDILVKPCKTELPSREAAPHSESKVDDKSDTVAKQAYMETVPLSKTSFMQDDIYDRQSFDYEFDTSSPLDDIDDKELHNAKERFLADPSQILIEKLNASSAPNDVPEDSRSSDGITSPNDSEAFTKPSPREYPQDPYSCFSEQEFNKKKTFADDVEHDNSLPSQKPGSNVQEDTKAAHCAPETNSSLDSSASEPTDSFVEFMRECLKSREDEEPENPYQGVPSKDELRKTSLPHSQSPPTAVMDLEQEKLTISALKELGSGQEAEDLRSAVSDRGQVQANASSTQQSSFTSGPYAPCPESHRVVDSTYSKEVEAIDEWVAEAYHLAEHVLTAILTHLSVKDLIHWRDPKKSGVVFGLSMLLLLSLAAFSVISVASYLLLALLCVTITFRIYKSVVQAVQKSNDGHPFKALIDKDVSIAPETFRKHVDASLTYINRALKQMSRLFLVEDLVDSLKLAVVMWLLTYVGAVFNGITILILANILLFAVPPVYEKNKTQIDQYIDLVRTQVNTTMAKLQEKLPGAVKRSKTE